MIDWLLIDWLTDWTNRQTDKKFSAYLLYTDKFTRQLQYIFFFRIYRGVVRRWLTDRQTDRQRGENLSAYLFYIYKFTGQFQYIFFFCIYRGIVRRWLTDWTDRQTQIDRETQTDRQTDKDGQRQTDMWESEVLTFSILTSSLASSSIFSSFVFTGALLGGDWKQNRWLKLISSYCKFSHTVQILYIVNRLLFASILFFVRFARTILFREYKTQWLYLLHPFTHKSRLIFWASRENKMPKKVTGNVIWIVKVKRRKQKTVYNILLSSLKTCFDLVVHVPLNKVSN